MSSNPNGDADRLRQAGQAQSTSATSSFPVNLSQEIEHSFILRRLFDRLYHKLRRDISALQQEVSMPFWIIAT